jgi:hypothetical protein
MNTYYCHNHYRKCPHRHRITNECMFWNINDCLMAKLFPREKDKNKHLEAN